MTTDINSGVKGVSFSDLQKLTNRIYSAAISQHQWSWFLSDIHRISGGVKVHMSSHDLRSGVPLHHLHHGFEPGYMSSHQDYYGAMNPWAGGFADRPAGQVFSTQNLCAKSDLQKTEFYNDWVRPQENAQGGGAVILSQDQSRMFTMGGIIRDVDQDKIEDRWLKLLQFLVPHLNQAMDINAMMGNSALDNRILREGLEPKTAACFVLAQNRTVMYANAQGETLLESGHVVQQGPRAKLRFKNARPDTELAKALFSFSNTEIGFSPPFFVQQDGTRKTFICRTTRMQVTDVTPAPHPLKYDASKYLLLLMAPIRTRALVPS